MSDDMRTQDWENHLHAALLSSSSQYDAAVLSLSSGLLAISLAFIKDVVPLEEAVFRFGLVVSWGLLAGAVVATVCSFLTSQTCIRLYIEGKDERGKKWSSATEFLNRISAALFVSGIILTVVFVSMNVLPREHDMEKKKDVVTVTEGYVPSNRPKPAGEERGYVPPERPPRQSESDSSGTDKK